MFTLGLQLKVGNWSLFISNTRKKSIKCKSSDFLLIIGSLNFLKKDSLGVNYHMCFQNKV